LSNLGRREDALTAIEEAVLSILPRLESAPYLLSDSGSRIARRYLDCNTALDRDPDQELVRRMFDVIKSAAAIDTSGDDRTHDPER